MRLHTLCVAVKRIVCEITGAFGRYLADAMLLILLAAADGVDSLLVGHGCRCCDPGGRLDVCLEGSFPGISEVVESPCECWVLSCRAVKRIGDLVVLGEDHVDLFNRGEFRAETSLFE
jgi:hypothetical protein